MSLYQSGKNEPKTQFGLKMAIFLHDQKIESEFFCEKKITFDFLF